MHVAQLWKYPVKSMLGGTVESARLVDTGVEDDRRWACYDEEAGSIANARKHGALMRCTAVDSDRQAIITLPDGTTFASDSPE